MAEPDSLLRRGVQAARNRNYEEARTIFGLLTRQEPDNTTAWLWLAGVTASRQERQAALEQVLALEPDNEMAITGLRALGVEPKRRTAALDGSEELALLEALMQEPAPESATAEPADGPELMPFSLEKFGIADAESRPDASEMVARLRRLRERRESRPHPGQGVANGTLESRFRPGDKIVCLPYGAGEVLESRVEDEHELLVVSFPEHGELTIDAVMSGARLAQQVPELAPFSFDDLSLSPEEIAALESAPAAGSQDEAKPRQPAEEPELTPFSLEDLGLSPEEIAALEGAPPPAAAMPAVGDEFDDLNPFDWSSIEAPAQPSAEPSDTEAESDIDLSELTPFSLDDLDLEVPADDAGATALPRSLQPFSLEDLSQTEGEASEPHSRTVPEPVPVANSNTEGSRLVVDHVGSLPPAAQNMSALPASTSAVIQEFVLIPSFDPRYQPPEQILSITIRADQVEVRFAGRRYLSPTKLDSIALLEAASSPRRYGELLFEAIFHSEAIEGFPSTIEAYTQARSDAHESLRVSLAIDPLGLAINTHRWEYMCDPRRATEAPLATMERWPLYRLQASGPPRAVEARPLKVLVAICNPAPLGQPGNQLLSHLNPIDVVIQQTIVEGALRPLAKAGLISYTVIGGTDGAPATLECLREEVQRGYHVLHLLAHGVMVHGEYHVVMDREGKLPFVHTTELKDTLSQQILRLLVLTPCQSAIPASLGSTPTSLGSLLVQRGLPAVIAMQDLVAINTIQVFTQHFYDDLARSGRVDMALAATRFALYQWAGPDQGDWGIPVLYMSDDDGRLFDVDEEGAARFQRRAPTIKSFGPSEHQERAATQQLSRLIEDHSRVIGLGAGRISELRAAVSVAAAKPLETRTLATPQDRERLNQLRRPVRIDATALRHYVMHEGSGVEVSTAIYRQIAIALTMGKHIILIGPPGTGKTSLGHDICRFVAHPERAYTHRMVATTASADWTTFDTIGGYMPTQEQTLAFRPGIFLRALSAGDWLFIDEINRAEIDKAFGELFSVLAGQSVDLPYWVGEHQVRVLPAHFSRDPTVAWVPAEAISPYDYVIHPNWRIIGAMNVYDKASLFGMSFAFMRRFAFIDLDVPETEIYDRSLIPFWTRAHPLPDGSRMLLAEKVRQLLSTRILMSRRALGPAIIKDIVHHVCESFDPDEPDGVEKQFAEALMLYAVPQLDALDHAVIAAIYHELHVLLTPGPARALVLARIRALYPHIHDEEWLS